MSSDGVTFCLDSVDLNSGTNALTQFMTKTQLQSPYRTKENVCRNPANKDAGKLVTLDKFLELAKEKATTGILIDIQNAPFLASKAGLDIVGIVTSARKKCHTQQAIDSKGHDQIR